MNARHTKLLTELLSQPTAPFREEHVTAVAQRVLEQAGIPFFRDPVGNVVIGCASRVDYRRLVRDKSREPLRLFIAHMDHPGFHGTQWISSSRLKVTWHGGSPARHVSGSRVWLATEKGYWAEGELNRVRLLKSGHAIQSAEVQISGGAKSARPRADSLYGGFEFRAPVWRAGKKIYTKAADDLVGVFAILTTALGLHKKPAAKNHRLFSVCSRAPRKSASSAPSAILNSAGSSARAGR